MGGGQLSSEWSFGVPCCQLHLLGEGERADVEKAWPGNGGSAPSAMARASERKGIWQMGLFLITALCHGRGIVGFDGQLGAPATHRGG